MKVLTILVIVNICLGHPYCDRYKCSCSYNFENYCCLSICPTGYYNDTNLKCVSSGSTSLISSLFVRNWNFNSLISNWFSFVASSSSKPVVTFDRGIYFTGTNNLLSGNTLVISPTFTLRFIAKFAGDGIIFRMFTSNDIFKVYVDSNRLCIEAIMTIISVDGTSLIYTDQQNTLCVSFDYNIWYVVKLNFGQDLYYLTVSLLISENIQNYNSYQYNNYEFLQQSDSTKYELGSASNSFKGFLYELLLDNTSISTYDIYYNFVDCEYNEYFYYQEKICRTCSSPSDSIQCINSGGYCYSNVCNGCTSFYMSECNSCSNSQTAPYCGSTYFAKTSCYEGMVLYKSICINTLTFPDQSDINTPVFNAVFITFDQYYGGVFFSGNNPDTYYPFMSPEEDDPFLVMNRGLYFNGNHYLQSNTEISLNLDFFVAFWVWSTGSTTIWSSNFLSILEGSIIKICFYNGFDDYCLSNHNRNPVYDWNFLAVKVKYDESTKESSFSNILGSSVIETISVPGYTFLNEPSLVYIGKDDTTYFIGFIYQILIWNAAEVSFDSYYTSTCISSSLSCLWFYQYTEFYNVYRTMSQLCDPSCTSGCSKWGTCNPCKESDCSICTDFYSTCTEYGSSTCFEPLQLTGEKDCCDIQCKECYGVYFYNCRACFEGQILAENVCVVQCPIGFTAQNETCLNGNSQSLSIQFGSLKNETIDSIGMVKFATGGNGYPDFNQNDPIPSLGRGLYFSANSFMQSDEFLIFHTFTLVFYAKVHSSGTFMVKGSSFIKFTNSKLEALFNDATIDFSISSLNIWSRYVFQLESSIDGYFSLYCYKDYSPYYMSRPNYVFMDSLSPLILGSSTNSFTGFMYLLSIYNSFGSFTEGIPITCTTSFDYTCLINCDFSSYFSSGSCIPCPDCLYGCHSNHCNICAVKYCTYCTEVAGECLNCKEPFNLISQTCSCYSGYFANSLEMCQKCSFNCVECVDLSDKCTSCGSNTQLINNVCYCLESFVQFYTESGFFECGCPANSILSDRTCVCIDGYARKNNACEPCNQNSLTCSGTEYYQCLTCKEFYILDQGICYQSCTLGYQNIDQSCVSTQVDSNVFNIKFNVKSRPLNDTINGLGIEYSGNQIDNSGPKSVLYRGLYFNGKGDYFKFPSPDIDVPVLSYKFSILLCVYLNSYTNTVFVKQNSENSLVHLNVYQGQIRASLYFNGEIASVKDNGKVEIHEWTYVMLSVGFSGNSFVKVSVNGVDGSAVLASEAPFLDYVESPFVFGLKDSDSFNGFIYLVSVYNKDLNPSDAVYDIQMCSSDHISFNCLSNCPINTFYDTTDMTCYNCLEECELTGCINNSTCSECIDIHCKECSDFETCDICEYDYELSNGVCTRCGAEFYYKNLKCIKCSPGTYSVNNICSTCSSSEYYDPSNKVCIPCMPLCDSCENSTVCTSCVTNSEYTDQGYCSCLAPYKAYSNLCLIIQTYFNVSISVNLENSVKLFFTEPINGTFNESHLALMLNSKSLTFSILKLSEISYELQINYPKVIGKGSRLYFNFSDELVSVNNSTLYDSLLSVTLYPVSADSLSNLIADAQSYARGGVTSGLAVAFGCSFISWDPTSVFSFLSTAELYYPISLYNSNFPDNIQKFFSELRVQSMFPNIFKTLIGTSRGSPVSKELNNLGFSKNLILVNIGVNITIGLIIAIVYFILKTLSFSERLKQYIKSIKKKFEFSIFIRFWVQSYLEFLLGACICIKYSKFSSPIENFDFFLALVIMIIQIGGMLVLMYFIKKRTRIEEENIESFLISYGVIFDEFKAYDISLWIFYLLYVSRRFSTIIFAVFVDSGTLQLVISFIFSLSILFYTLTTMCFKNLISNIYVILNELLYIITIFIAFYHTLSINSGSQAGTSHIIRSVTAAWVLNIIYNVSLLLQKYIQKCFRPKNAKVTDANIISLNDTRVNNNPDDKINPSPEISLKPKQS